MRWSAAVRPLDFHYEEAVWWRWLQNGFAYRIHPVNGTHHPGWGRSNRCNPDPVGTISCIQRLDRGGMHPLDPATGAAITGW